MKSAAENKASQREFMAGQVFNKCRAFATWLANDDFFFCHWLAESEEDIHAVLRENGRDQLIFTACYEISIHIDDRCLTDDRAFPFGALEAMETA